MMTNETKKSIPLAVSASVYRCAVDLLIIANILNEHHGKTMIRFVERGKLLNECIKCTSQICIAHLHSTVTLFVNFYLSHLHKNLIYKF